jgi:predicted metalloprotease with PDZ domain
VALSLSEKMGMVVNPDGQVSKVISGGQAAALGLSVGCRIVRADGAACASLADLKQVFTRQQAKRALSCEGTRTDQRRNVSVTFFLCLRFCRSSTNAVRAGQRAARWSTAILGAQPWLQQRRSISGRSEPVPR